MPKLKSLLHPLREHNKKNRDLVKIVINKGKIGKGQRPFSYCLRAGEDEMKSDEAQRAQSRQENTEIFRIGSKKIGKEI